MLIPLFTFIFIIQLTRSQQMNNITQVIFNASHQWELKMDTANQSIFQVKQLDTKYCYVRISLLNKDAGLLAMADYEIYPNISLYEHYKQGEKIDRISQFENRKTRFLKLKPRIGIIYILIKGNITNNIYTISISGSNEEQCDNDCSNNGICKAKGCSCNKSFVGNDCHSIAEEVFEGTSKQLNISTQKSLQYFYIDVGSLKNFTLRFEFSVSYASISDDNTCYRCLTFWSLMTKSLIQIDYWEYYIYLPFQFYELWRETTIEDGSSAILYRIPLNLSVQNQVLMFALGKDYDTIDQVEIQMNITKEEIIYDENENGNDDSEETNRLLSIIIPTVVGTLIIVALIYFYLRRRRLLVNLNNAAAQQNQYRIPNNQQPPVQEPEKCAICLEDLHATYMARVKIQCGHQFHLNCIQGWARNQQGEKQCPFCRRQYNPEQIQ